MRDGSRLCFMLERSSLNSFDDLRVEVAAHRLVIRAILTYLACANENASQTLTEICAVLEGTGPYPVRAEELDDMLRQAAMARARTRMARFIVDVQNLPIARG